MPSLGFHDSIFSSYQVKNSNAIVLVFEKQMLIIKYILLGSREVQRHANVSPIAKSKEMLICHCNKIFYKKRLAQMQ